MTRTTCEIPGHTALSDDHACNFWVYSRNCAIVLCTQAFPRYGVTFAHVLTYLPNPCALSIKMAGQQDIKTLEYSQVVKIPESEGMLVRQCSIRLRELGLTLWVVSILMYDQEFHNKKMFLFFVSLIPHGSQQSQQGAHVYNQEF